MRVVLLSLLALVGTATIAAQISPAHAQLSHTWVASGGTDGNNCDRPTPCASFQGAFGKTAVGGEITCVDSGNFGGLAINKSITINCEAAIGSTTVAGGVTASGLVVTTATSDIVTLRGLDIDGMGFSCNGGALIAFSGGGALLVEKMRINNIRGNCSGILFQPSAPAKLYVADSAITNVASSGIAAAIFIKPAAGVEAKITIERSRLDNNLFGIIAAGSDGGTIRGLVSDSFISGNNNNGITVATASTSVVLAIDNTKISGNNYGLVATGTNAGMLVRRSLIAVNGTGVFASGGALYTYRDNSVNGNTTDGAFTGFINMQ